MNVVKSICVVPLALVLLAPLNSLHAQDALVGSWVLDAAASKSSVPEMAPAGGTLTITDAGNGRFKSTSEVTIGGVTGHSEITYAVDGKDYAVTLSPSQPGVQLTQSIERVSDAVYKSSVKINGQPVGAVATEISADRNTLTQTTKGIGEFGALSSTVVFKRK